MFLTNWKEILIRVIAFRVEEARTISWGSECGETFDCTLQQMYSPTS